MEGIPGWLILGLFAVYGVALIALGPALASVVCLLTHRPGQARTLFATTLLVEAVVWSAFCFLIMSQEFHTDDDRILNRLPVGLGLTGVNLLLAGCGQHVAARRGSRPWLPTLALAAGVVLVIWYSHSVEYTPAVALIGLPLAVGCVLVGMRRAPQVSIGE